MYVQNEDNSNASNDAGRITTPTKLTSNQQIAPTFNNATKQAAIVTVDDHSDNSGGGGGDGGGGDDLFSHHYEHFLKFIFQNVHALLLLLILLGFIPVPAHSLWAFRHAQA